MSELYKKIYQETDKGTPHNHYNVNSFRGVTNHAHINDKNKFEKEIKVLSPRIVVDKKEKEADSNQKQQIKPRLLTGRLPAAFDVKYRR
jgi:hypothetical protein